MFNHNKFAYYDKPMDPEYEAYLDGLFEEANAKKSGIMKHLSWPKSIVQVTKPVVNGIKSVKPNLKELRVNIKAKHYERKLKTQEMERQNLEIKRMAHEKALSRISKARDLETHQVGAHKDTKRTATKMQPQPQPPLIQKSQYHRLKQPSCRMKTNSEPRQQLLVSKTPKLNTPPQKLKSNSPNKKELKTQSNCFKPQQDIKPVAIPQKVTRFVQSKACAPKVKPDVAPTTSNEAAKAAARKAFENLKPISGTPIKAQPKLPTNNSTKSLKKTSSKTKAANGPSPLKKTSPKSPAKTTSKSPGMLLRSPRSSITTTPKTPVKQKTETSLAEDAQRVQKKWEKRNIVDCGTPDWTPFGTVTALPSGNKVIGGEPRNLLKIFEELPSLQSDEKSSSNSSNTKDTPLSLIDSSPLALMKKATTLKSSDEKRVASSPSSAGSMSDKLRSVADNNVFPKSTGLAI